jgi:hypothetical protein
MDFSRDTNLDQACNPQVRGHAVEPKSSQYYRPRGQAMFGSIAEVMG